MSVKSKPTLKNQAVKAALDNDWSTAIDYNKQILEHQPEDIATLNRLGYALTHIGAIDSAKSTYERVLKLDKYNPIAKKSLQKLASLKPGIVIKKSNNNKIRTSFIEEPGKTKTISLIRPGTTKTILSISMGMPVRLVPKKRRVCVETYEGEYIGCIPDDIGLRLEKLIKIGYNYETNIKAIANKSVSIFVREVTRSIKAKNVPSFPGSNAIVLQTDKLINNTLNSIPVDTTPTGEDLADD